MTQPQCQCLTNGLSSCMMRYVSSASHKLRIDDPLIYSLRPINAAVLTSPLPTSSPLLLDRSLSTSTILASTPRSLCFALVLVVRICAGIKTRYRSKCIFSGRTFETVSLCGTVFFVVFPLLLPLIISAIAFVI